MHVDNHVGLNLLPHSCNVVGCQRLLSLCKLACVALKAFCFWRELYKWVVDLLIQLAIQRQTPSGVACSPLAALD